MTYIYSFTIKQDSPSRKQWKDHALTPCKQKQCIFDLGAGGEPNQLYPRGNSCWKNACNFWPKLNTILYVGGENNISEEIVFNKHD